MSMNEFEKVVNKFKTKKTFNEEDCSNFISEMKKLDPGVMSDNLTDLMETVNNLSETDRENHWFVKMMIVNLKSYVEMTKFLIEMSLGIKSE